MNATKRAIPSLKSYDGYGRQWPMMVKNHSR
jgi:hypothetical protein